MTAVLRTVLALTVATALLAAGIGLRAQEAPGRVTYEQLLAAAETPENWLTYSGAYSSSPALSSDTSRF